MPGHSTRSRREADTAPLPTITAHKAAVIPPTNGRDVAPVDVVFCGSCGACTSVAHITSTKQLDTRMVPGERRGQGTQVQGVFCPACGQRMYDETSWAEHLADRRYEQRIREIEDPSLIEEKRPAKTSPKQPQRPEPMRGVRVPDEDEDVPVAPRKAS